ncbi:helix-turn-helix domain-containing protein [Alkalibacillus silvisoli]|uniref:Helix-turn-helix domain-containing protein n=1 Tax=Alkalibacillus silvisoli TaxID=392823 RepID=A0ABP3JQ74_9BACI
MSFHVFILYLLNHIEGQRTTSSIYHILRGKKSSQTIQDARLFRLGPYLGLLPRFNKEEFDQIVNELVDKGLIVNSDHITYLTDHSKSLIKKDQWYSSIYFNGEEFSHLIVSFYQKLQLLVQSVSYLSNQQSNFIPIAEDFKVQQDVKLILKSPNVLNQQGEQLYQEMNQLLHEVDEQHANILMMNLTGFDQVGMSIRQIANQLHEPERIIQLKLISTIHVWLTVIKSNENDFQIVSQLIPNQHHINLTQSALKTYELLNQNHSIDQVVYIRKLKRSTIEDHVVEIATKNKTFSTNLYVPSKLEQEIKKVVLKHDTKRLKLLKEKLPEEVSYFQIRLVIARLHDEQAMREVASHE